MKLSILLRCDNTEFLTKDQLQQFRKQFEENLLKRFHTLNNLASQIIVYKESFDRGECMHDIERTYMLAVEDTLERMPVGSRELVFFDCNLHKEL